MTSTRFARLSVAALVSYCLVAPVHAAIPPAVEAMIREAAKSGESATVDTVVAIAQATNPDDTEEIAALAAALLTETQALAEQEKQDKIASQGYFEGWTGQGEAGVGNTTGNTDEVSGVLGLSLVREGIKLRHKLSALVDYRRTNGATSREKYAASYGMDYFLHDGLYIYGLIGWERDEFAGYTRRFTQSAGIGYQALKTDHMTLTLDAGPALRQTSYVDTGDENEFAGRASLAYRWKFNDGWEFAQDASILSGTVNTTLISTTSLTAAVSKSLSTRLSFNLQKEKNPPIGRESTDTATRASIVYSFN